MSYNIFNGFNEEAVMASFMIERVCRVYELEEIVHDLGYNIPVLIGDYFDPRIYTFPMAAYVGGECIIVNDLMLDNLVLARAIIAHELGHEFHGDRERRINPEFSGILCRNFYEVEADEFAISHSPRESGEELVRFLSNFAAMLPHEAIVTRRQFNTRIQSARQNIRRYHAA